MATVLVEKFEVNSSTSVEAVSLDTQCLTAGQALFLVRQGRLSLAEAAVAVANYDHRYQTGGEEARRLARLTSPKKVASIFS